MKWQDSISTTLSLDDGQSKVILDHTGVLFQESFINYLETQGISFVFCLSISEMLPWINKPEPKLIITTLEKVPAFICNARECRTFNFNNLPINGDAYKALNKYTTKQLIQLLEVVYDSDRHAPINQNDIDALLTKANHLKFEKELKSIQEELYQLITEEPVINNLTLASMLIGKLNYLTYTSGKVIELEFYEKVDDWSTYFFVNNGMEQVFFASMPKRPLSVDKIIPHIREHKHEKVALLCLDCMGFTEWNLLKEYLELEDSKLDVKAVFSMLPSVTRISRMAIFEGHREVYNIKVPGRLAEAKALANNFKSKHTRYLTGNDEISENNLVGYDVVSILYNFFDDLAHSVQFPPGQEDKTLYLKAVEDYIEKSSIKHDVQVLKDQGYNIYLCSDHGSVVAKGNGKRIEKYLVDGFAKRAIIIQAENSEFLEMVQINVPFDSSKKVVLPEGRTMFSNKDKIEVNHGGITIEEMIVPFIKLI